MANCALIKDNVVTTIIAINEDTAVLIPDGTQVSSGYTYDPVSGTFSAPISE